MSRVERPGVVAGQHIQDLIELRLSRRSMMLSAAAATGLTAIPLIGRNGRAIAGDSSLTFTELDKTYDEKDHLAPGYSREVLLRWGDPVISGAPKFDPATLTAGAQQQFGYNCDFTAFMPLPVGSSNSDHGLLCVNHEYTNAHVMWPGMTEDDGGKKLDKSQIEVTMAAIGHSVVEIKKADGKWQVVPDSKLNRRITALTEMRLSGPAAGHDWLKTSADMSGTSVIGTNDNCGGGTTPWGTILFCEEGSADYFGGDPAKTPMAAHYERYGYSAEDGDYYGWARFHNRFNVEIEPNEANRFEWVVEYDPYDPASMPVKRTALGRFGHEAATTILNKDGRIVVYMGDDDYNEYVYRFVSSGKFNPSDRAANFNLLDDGTLSVARFDADGSLVWLPLTHGQGPLTPANGFSNQGDVLIQVKRAGDLLGATAMDRPEDFEADPVTGRVYLVLTKNKKRETVDAANPRVKNPTGHIIELTPPGDGRQLDHAAGSFKWDHFILAGDPRNPEHAAQYHPAVSANGWLANPDNLAFDPQGRMWIATDGAPSFDIADGLYGVDTTGPGRALPKLIYAAPMGAEITGPSFTPDGQTLFLSVQHPAENSETLDKATTRWPDFNEKIPPRPAVIVITRDGGGFIGT